MGRYPGDWQDACPSFRTGLHWTGQFGKLVLLEQRRPSAVHHPQFSAKVRHEYQLILQLEKKKRFMRFIFIFFKFIYLVFL